MKLEKNVPPKDLLELEAGLGTDFLEHSAACANHHSLMSIALDDNHRGYPCQPALGLIAEVLDCDCGGKRNLLPHRNEELLPNNLSAEHSFTLIGIFVSGH